MRKALPLFAFHGMVKPTEPGQRFLERLFPGTLHSVFTERSQVAGDDAHLGGKQRQVNFCEFEANLDCMASSKTAKAT